MYCINVSVCVREADRGEATRLLWTGHLFTVSAIHQQNGSLLVTSDADL